MAENVQLALEQMLPELEDLRMKGYFSDAELAKIVETRTDFEYKMRRRRPDKTTFVRYLEYELALERLRVKRRAKLGLPATLVSKADSAILSRIHFIYTRLLWRYPGDLADWVRYFAFCQRHKSYKRLSEAFAKALRYHVTKPELWILAARFEFDVMTNMVSARALLQRALRLNAASLPLWVEYLKLELLYMQKLIDRRRVLDLPVPSVPPRSAAAAAAGADATESDAALAAALAPRPSDLPAAGESDGDDDGSESESDDSAGGGFESEPDDDASDDDDGEQVRREMEAGEAATDAEAAAVKDSLLLAALPRAVFRGAVAKFPASLALRTTAIALYHHFDNTELAVDDAYASIAALVDANSDDGDAAEFAAALAALAARPLVAYLASLSRNTDAMFDAHAFDAAWLASEARFEAVYAASPLPELVEERMALLVRVIEFAAAHGGHCAFTVIRAAFDLAAAAAADATHTPTSARAWVHLRAALPDAATPAGVPSLPDVASAAAALFPASAPLAALALGALAAAGAAPGDIVAAGLAALGELGETHSALLASGGPFTDDENAEREAVHGMWRRVLRTALYGGAGGRAGVGKKARRELFEAAAGALPGGEAEMIIFRWVASTAASVKKVRKTYRALLARSVVRSRPLLAAVITFESRLPVPDPNVLGPLHNDITAAFGAADPALWLDWVRTLVAAAAPPSRITAVYKAAVAALAAGADDDTVQAFIVAYQALVA